MQRGIARICTPCGFLYAAIRRNLSAADQVDVTHNPMLTLFHHPLCPHSRFVRIAMGEYGLNPTLVEERPWERRNEFLALNPAGTTPVLLEEGHPAVPCAAIIAEYLDETRGVALGSHRLLPVDLAGRDRPATGDDCQAPHRASRR